MWRVGIGMPNIRVVVIAEEEVISGETTALDCIAKA